MHKRGVILICLICLGTVAKAQSIKDLFQPAADSVYEYLQDFAKGEKLFVSKVSVKKGLKVTFNKALSDYPFRQEQVDSVKSIIKRNMPSKYALYKANFNVFSNGYSLDELASVYFSDERSDKYSRQHSELAGRYRDKDFRPLAVRENTEAEYENGLYNRHIAVWPSHGYYYNQDEARWKWQRARYFETIEDLYTASYVVPYLVPMLENAGAVVVLPRERDWNVNEAVVDNNSNGYSESGTWKMSSKSGFGPKITFVQGENPFATGSAKIAESRRGNSASWTPDIPQTGEYSVYIAYQSFPNSSDSVRYVVHHSGGSTSFIVNQKIGGGTWIYLGKFLFEKGYSTGQMVEVQPLSDDKSDVISADAVRFGGGMGNIARKPSDVDEDGKTIIRNFTASETLSGMPRFAEGARYYLQWAGMADSVYSSKKNTSDYNEDVAARGLWVNELSGGSYMNPEKEGFGIPIDLSFALHSDAGVYPNDSIIGTMAIYTSDNEGFCKFKNGESRFISRDYADIVQTQIVNDIRATFSKDWSRRQILDRSYSETRVPEVPAIIIELLAHQNFADMQYGSDPAFKFIVSRAIYKGILKYMAYLNEYDYTVQPLPVNSMKCELTDEAEAVISWKETIDSLESTAVPDYYILYTRIDGKGWDNGKRVNSASAKIELDKGHIYSFKVTAANKGGESMPSEILSVGYAGKKAKCALIVNNFDRVSGPSSFASPDDAVAGFRDYIDRGVPYIQDASYVGSQIEFRREKEWINDDNSGFGDSNSDYAGKVIAGNSFDYPYVHGKAIMGSGYSFCSISNKSVSEVELSKYDVVDVICGKQVTTKTGNDTSLPLRYRVFDEKIQNGLKSYCKNGGKLIVSGANIAFDIWDQMYQFERDSVYNATATIPSKDFVKNVLKFDNLGHFSIKNGTVKTSNDSFDQMTKRVYNYTTDYNPVQYAVESVDGIMPADKKARTIFRYGENGVSAGVAYLGDDYSVISLGFPIEALTSQQQIENMMSDLLDLLNSTGVNGRK